MKEYLILIIGIVLLAYGLGFLNPTAYIIQKDAVSENIQNAEQKETPEETLIPSEQEEQTEEAAPPENKQETQPQVNPPATETQQQQNPTESETQNTQNIQEQQQPPPPNPCDGIVCENSVTTCPDGFQVSCTNSCNPNSGQCSSCTPSCEGHEAQQTQLDHLIFSQIYYYSPTNYSTEWIELYNPTQNTIDLTGWTINDNSDRNTWTFPEGVTIKENSFLVIVRKAEEFKTLFSCPYYLDTWKNNSILNNNGDQLALKTSEGNEVDFVAWSGGYDNSYPDWIISATPEKTIKRASSNKDTDSPEDWLSNQDAVPHC